MSARHTCAAAVLAVAMLSLTSCGPSRTENPPAQAPAAGTPGQTTAVAATEPPGATTPTGAAVVLRGDAATNPACALATPVEIAQAAGGGSIVDELGVTSPGGYSPANWSCTWHFTDTEISAPAVVVMFERTAAPHPEVVAYDKSLVTQRYATAVPGLGDVAILRGDDVDLVAGKILMKVHVLVHNTGPEGDQAIAVARLVLPRVSP